MMGDRTPYNVRNTESSLPGTSTSYIRVHSSSKHNSKTSNFNIRHTSLSSDVLSRTTCYSSARRSMDDIFSSVPHNRPAECHSSIRLLYEQIIIVTMYLACFSPRPDSCRIYNPSLFFCYFVSVLTLRTRKHPPFLPPPIILQVFGLSMVWAALRS